MSWKSSGTISVRLYAFTNYRERETNETYENTPGHSFLVFYNNTSSSIQVGKYLLSSKDTVSVGLWQKGAGGGSSSTSSGNSSQNSSSGSCSGSDYNGIYYNKESYYYNYIEEMRNAVNYEVTISTNTLQEISTIIENKNDTYSLIGYNCSTFSTEIWNKIENTNWSTWWFRNPKAVMTDIKNEYKNTYTKYNTLPLKNSFCHWDSGKKYWITSGDSNN